MITRLFHNWERRLAAAAENRTVRPFDWGLEWVPGLDGGGADAPSQLLDWADATVPNSDAFFAAPARPTRSPATASPSRARSSRRTPRTTPCVARYFPDASPAGRKRAVLVLPQWNADAEGHVGLCRLMNRFGITALRLSLPYHDTRMPPELLRADYIVSANIGRTLAVCRQAVLDARQAIAWLAFAGLRVDRHPGHQPRVVPVDADGRARAAGQGRGAEPHLAVLRRRHLERALDRCTCARHSTSNVDLDSLRRIWMPISPLPYIERVRNKRTLLVYARYDLTFPVELSRMLVNEFRGKRLPHELAVLPCGHYSTGVTPFKYLDGLTLCRFLGRNL